MRRRRPRRTPRQVHRRRIRLGIAAAVLILIGTILTFTKQLPFLGSGYQLHAVFASANQLKPGDEVRMAGLPAGKVTAIDSGPHNTALVTMDITSAGQPVHADATLAIEPRLFLEGSFYVALSQGSPTAPALGSGATIAETHTRIPVQYDQFLDVFNAPVRQAFKSTLSQFAAGLGGGPAGGRGSRPGSSGTGTGTGTGAGALRGAVREFAGALPSATQVAEAAQGTQPGDLAKLVTESDAVTQQLARDPAALRGIVTDTDHVAAALSADTAALQGTIQGFDTLLQQAPGALSVVNRTLPTVNAFARDLRPGLRAAPGPLRAVGDLLGQVSQLVSRPELPRLIDSLAPVVTALGPLQHQLSTLFPRLTELGRCVSGHIVPVLNEKVADGSLSTGDPAWLDLFHSGTGLSGLSSDFDANGVAVRAGVTAGDQTVSANVPGLGKLVGSSSGAIEGVDPQWLGPDVEPPWRPDQPCVNQAPPDLGARRVAGSGGLKVSLTRHAR
jgi:phospholipid/cholesterol/gamma-HCH transport system substrate-binding protein